MYLPYLSITHREIKQPEPVNVGRHGGSKGVKGHWQGEGQLRRVAAGGRVPESDPTIHRARLTL